MASSLAAMASPFGGHEFIFWRPASTSLFVAGKSRDKSLGTGVGKVWAAVGILNALRMKKIF
jgi:hypothetical protein